MTIGILGARLQKCARIFPLLGMKILRLCCTCEKEKLCENFPHIRNGPDSGYVVLQHWLYLGANQISWLNLRLLVIFSAPLITTGNLLGSSGHSTTCISAPSHKMHHITDLEKQHHFEGLFIMDADLQQHLQACEVSPMYTSIQFFIYHLPHTQSLPPWQ